MLNFQFNVLGVLAATVANFIVAGIYFGVLIKNPYKIAMGRAGEPDKKPAPLMMIGPMFCNLIMAVAAAILISSLKIQTINDVIPFALLIAVGYLMPMTMMIAINPNFPRPFYYTIINAPYFLISSVMTSLILVAIG